MKVLVLISMLLTASCTHLSSVSQTSIPAKKGKVVKTTVDNNIFFFFNFSNSYLDAINEKLAMQCENGKISGILTKHESITYFPIIFHKIRVTAEGYCNE